MRRALEGRLQPASEVLVGELVGKAVGAHVALNAALTLSSAVLAVLMLPFACEVVLPAVDSANLHWLRFTSRRIGLLMKCVT